MPAGGDSGCILDGTGAGTPSMSFCLYLRTGMDLMLACAHSFSWPSSWPSASNHLALGASATDSVMAVFQKLYILWASLTWRIMPYFLRLLSTTNSSPYTGTIGMNLPGQSYSSSTSMAVHLIILTCLRSVGRSSTMYTPVRASISLGGNFALKTLLPSESRYKVSFLCSVYQNSAILMSSFITHSALLSPVPLWVKPTPVSASGYNFSNSFLDTIVVTKQRSASDPSGNTELGSK